ncbi:MAG: hypothetical protein ACTSWY_09085 [Promethearchaeota archaeon]
MVKIKKLCQKCAWAVYRETSDRKKVIYDSGIGAQYLCRKLNILIYGTDRACPNFVLSDDEFEEI